MAKVKRDLVSVYSYGYGAISYAFGALSIYLASEMPFHPSFVDRTVTDKSLCTSARSLTQLHTPSSLALVLPKDTH